jgi:hypothetical protein
MRAQRVLVGFEALEPSFPPTFKRYRGKGLKAYYKYKAGSNAMGNRRSLRYSGDFGQHAIGTYYM